MSVELYEREMKKALEEDGEDSNIYSYYKIMYEVAKDEKEKDMVVESFKGKTKKAVSLMRKLNDLEIERDEDTPMDKEIDKLVKKIKHNLNQHELDINLKIKELQKTLDDIEIIRMYSINDYYARDPTMWFYKVRDLIRDRKKRSESK